MIKRLPKPNEFVSMRPGQQIGILYDRIELLIIQANQTEDSAPLHDKFSPIKHLVCAAICEAVVKVRHDAGALLSDSQVNHMGNEYADKILKEMKE